MLLFMALSLLQKRNSTKVIPLELMNLKEIWLYHTFLRNYYHLKQYNHVPVGHIHWLIKQGSKFHSEGQRVSWAFLVGFCYVFFF